MSVSMNPGAIALAVMPRDANSRATDFVKPMSAALLARVADQPNHGGDIDDAP
jgi:hypothetical protein